MFSLSSRIASKVRFFHSARRVQWERSQKMQNACPITLLAASF
jgi:hypothetical protein